MAIIEICRGSRTFTYRSYPGIASAEQALLAYHVLTTSFPGVLGLLMKAAQDRKREFTVEIGTLNRRDDLIFSKHDFIKCMPQILSNFRGRGRRI
jgi:hypothetical protein